MDMVNGIRAAFGGGPGRAPAGTKTTGTKTTGLLAAAVITLGLGLAGCGGSSDDDAGGKNGGASTAPAGNNGGNNAAGGDSAAKLVQYSQCMRKNGVSTFPDPVNGKLQLQIVKGSPMDPTNPTFQAAQQACKSLEPPGLYSGNPNQQQQDAALKFVRCMRKNGVPNFPDPQNGRFVISGVDPNSPQFQKAMQACRSLIPGGAATGGGQ